MSFWYWNVGEGVILSYFSDVIRIDHWVQTFVLPSLYIALNPFDEFRITDDWFEKFFCHYLFRFLFYAIFCRQEHLSWYTNPRGTTTWSNSLMFSFKQWWMFVKIYSSKQKQGQEPWIFLWWNVIFRKKTNLLSITLLLIFDRIVCWAD